jgi:hypothetical protein
MVARVDENGLTATGLISASTKTLNNTPNSAWNSSYIWNDRIRHWLKRASDELLCLRAADVLGRLAGAKKSAAG